ncbi:hypothetical protein BC938DRAFT_472462 [Jimgerdemannia flammicorona]|uniref:Ion transport domain-containing protein n=1 Tax=Jimgerdemannia flammicorona TaxID=994334 RepID=A0A433QU09_9FUNG|nr:hypothetical protein BC938DRAFT_472462 [Jimgerdemannia flammicorona]
MANLHIAIHVDRDDDDRSDITQNEGAIETFHHKPTEPLRAPDEVAALALNDTGEVAVLSNDGTLTLWRLSADPAADSVNIWSAPTTIPLTHETIFRLRRKIALSLSRSAEYVAVTYAYEDQGTHCSRFEVFAALNTGAKLPEFAEGQNCAAGFVEGDVLVVLQHYPGNIQLWDVRTWTIVKEYTWDFPHEWQWQTNVLIHQLTLLRKGFFISSGNDNLNVLTLHSLKDGPTENLYYLGDGVKDVLTMDISSDGAFLVLYTRSPEPALLCYSMKNGLKLSSTRTHEIQRMCFLSTGHLVVLVSTTYTVYDPFSLCPLHQFTDNDFLHTFCFEGGFHITMKSMTPRSLPLPHKSTGTPTSSTFLTIYPADDEKELKLTDASIDDSNIVENDQSLHGPHVFSTIATDKDLDKVWNLLRIHRGVTSWLDSNNKRFFSIGKYSIALFRGSRHRPDLEWVWNAPFRADKTTVEIDCIEMIKLETTSTGSQRLHVTLSSKSSTEPVVLELPDEENITLAQETAIVQNAAEFLALNAHFTDIRYQKRPPINDVIGLITNYTNKYPDRNVLSIVGECLPLGDLARLGIEKFFATFLDSENNGKGSVWVPMHNRRKESALAAAIQFQRTRLVSAIVNYCLDKAMENLPGQLGYMDIIVSSLPKLAVYHQDVSRTIAMRASYCTVWQHPGKGAPQHRKITGPSNHKNFHPLCIEPLASNFNGEFGATGKKFSWWSLRRDEHIDFHQAVLSVLPFPNMFVYPHDDIDWSKGLFHRDNRKAMWKTIIKPRSVYSTIALRRNLFVAPQLIYPIIYYKWEMFAGRIYTFLVCLQVIRLIFFSIAVFYPYSGLYATVLALAVLFLVQEVRQMAGHRLRYWFSMYNYFDLASLTFSAAASILALQGKIPPPWLNSFSVFFMWLHLLVQLRVFQGIGVTAAILYHIVQKAVWLLVVMFVVVISFAHALFLLLKNEDPAPSPTAFNGTLYATTGPLNITLQQTDQTATPTNAFKLFTTALLSVYLFLSGDYSTISAGYDGNIPVIIFRCTFVLLTAIILLNVLIALLNSVYTETAEQGERVWLHQMTELIAEIEVYWMGPKSRQNKRYFPKYIYYEAFLDKSNDWAAYVRQNTAPNPEFSAKDIRDTIESALASFVDASGGGGARAPAQPSAAGPSLHNVAAGLTAELENKLDERVASMQAEIADLKALLHEVLKRE